MRLALRPADILDGMMEDAEKESLISLHLEAAVHLLIDLRTQHYDSEYGGDYPRISSQLTKLIDEIPWERPNAYIAVED